MSCGRNRGVGCPAGRYVMFGGRYVSRSEVVEDSNGRYKGFRITSLG